MDNKTRVVRVGNVPVGGGNPVAVQSMTTTDTRDIAATTSQIERLQQAGCEIIRVAVVDEEAARAIAGITKNIHIPLVADIHFDYRLALASIKSGCDGLRINPGNIGSAWKIRELVKACRDHQIPIRIGVNAGSMDKEMIARYNGVTAAAMVDSAMGHIRILEEMGFHNIKLSLKASSVLLTVEAYRLISRKVDYPLHVGITEAGTSARGLIKSALGIGLLLSEGIGDTIRVSLTADPVEEVWAAYGILRALELRERGVELISCPTCGRCEINLIETAEQVDRETRSIAHPIKVAVMGCVVNGPGEAREADVGIAGGRGLGLLFKKGEIVAKVPEDQLLAVLLDEIRQLDREHHDR